MKLYSYDCLPSTNDTAKELIKSNSAQSSFAVLANEQSAGKGQHGNSWTSPVGGLYLSLALHEPALDTANHLAIDAKRLQIAIQIRQTLKNLCKVNTPICIKWPNDYYTIDGKLGGILCEAISAYPEWLIVGIGINVLRENEDTDTVTRAHDNATSVIPVNNNATSVIPVNNNTDSVIPANDNTDSVIPANDNTGSVIPANDNTDSVIPANNNADSVIPAEAGIHFSESVSDYAICYLEDYVEEDTVISIPEIADGLLGTLC